MINGKTLKKSLSLLLSVLMVASLCAVCFGTFASAYTANDVVIEGKVGGVEASRTIVYDWKNDDGSDASPNNFNHDYVSLSDASASNTGLTTAMKATSGQTSMGMIIGGASQIPATVAPSATIKTDSWYHKTLVYDEASKGLGGAALPGAVLLEAGTRYKVSVKYIPLTIHDGETIGFAVGGMNSRKNYQNFKNKATFTTAAYTQTDADDVADRDTFDIEGNDIKAAAKDYIATKGWETYELDFTLSANYAPSSLVYLALNASNSSSDMDKADSCWLAQFLVESVTVTVVDDDYVEVTYDKGSESITKYERLNGAVALPAPADNGKDFLYWESSTGDMYNAGQKVTITAATTFTAVYKEVINFIDDETGASDYINGDTDIFSNSAANNGGDSNLLKDENDKYTGGVHFHATVGTGYVNVNKAEWAQKVFLYDPDSDIVNADNPNPGYFKIKAGHSYKVTVTYKAAAGSALGIGVSSGTAVGSSMSNALVKADTKTTDDTEWQKLTCIIDGDGQATTALAGRFIILVCVVLDNSGKADFDIKDVTVVTTVNSDSKALVTANIEGTEDITLMNVGDTLLPAGKNSSDEASIGWVNENGGAITAVPETAPETFMTVYATYPSTVFNFESGKGVADYNCDGAQSESGIVTDPYDSNNMVVKIVAGSEDRNWIPAATGAHEYSIDTATTAYELKPSTKYNISFDYMVEAGSANPTIVLYRANKSDLSGKMRVYEFKFTADQNNLEQIEGFDTKYALIDRTGWVHITYDYESPADLDTNNHLCFVAYTHGVSGYDKNNIYYFDNLVIEELSAANEIYKTPVEDAKSSLRKESATQSAGLRFRGQINVDKAVEASEIGFVTIPVQLLAEADDAWYKLEGVNMSADKGKLDSGAAYVKINDHKKDTGYYAKANNDKSYQYQLCITGLNNDKSKAAQFMTVMYIRTGVNFEYKFVNIMSYNNVKQVYEANGITDY